MEQKVRILVEKREQSTTRCVRTVDQDHRDYIEVERKCAHLVEREPPTGGSHDKYPCLLKCRSPGVQVLVRAIATSGESQRAYREKQFTTRSSQGFVSLGERVDPPVSGRHHVVKVSELEQRLPLFVRSTKLLM